MIKIVSLSIANEDYIYMFSPTTFLVAKQTSVDAFFVASEFKRPKVIKEVKR